MKEFLYFCFSLCSSHWYSEGEAYLENPIFNNDWVTVNQIYCSLLRVKLNMITLKTAILAYIHYCYSCCYTDNLKEHFQDCIIIIYS